MKSGIMSFEMSWKNLQRASVKEFISNSVPESLLTYVQLNIKQFLLKLAAILKTFLVSYLYDIS